MHLSDCITTGITNQQCVPFPHCAIQFLSRIQWLQICKKQVWCAAVQDWIVGMTILLSGVGMAAFSFMLLRQGNSQWITLIVFSLIACGLGISDFIALKNRNATGKQRIARHLTNMLAGTIATVTAVLVTNVTTEPIWVAWLAPTVVITPVIFYWNKRTLS